jgi:hypothetical protein
VNTYETRSYQTHAGGQHKRRTLEADLIKLTLAIIAELLIFFFWLDAPIRERYEVLVHIALPICIVLPILNYRSLILVPFIAFLPDVARAFGIDISHSLALLPIVFLAAFLPFINRPRTALVAGYVAFAIVASHFIVDARKYAIIENVAGYPWSDLVLYTVLLTVLGFLLLQLSQITETSKNSKGLFPSSIHLK